MLMTVTFPTESFNTLVRGGTVGDKISQILEATKPESLYFTERNGQRTALVIVDVADPSKIPALAEPWFLTFQARVEVSIVMSVEELRRAGLDALGKRWG
jgi:hypothetical protein